MNRVERRRYGRQVRAYRRAGYSPQEARTLIIERIYAEAWDRVRTAVKPATDFTMSTYYPTCEWCRDDNTTGHPIRATGPWRAITWIDTPPAPPTYRHPRPVLTRKHR